MKLKISLRLSAACLTFATMTACSHGDANRKLDEKIAQEPAISTATELRTDMSKDIESSHLKEDQKAQLLALKDRAAKARDDLREKSRKLREILVKDLVQSDYDEEEVLLIKGRLKDVESQRLDVIFQSVTEANKILGRFKPEHERLLDEMIETRVGRAY